MQKWSLAECRVAGQHRRIGAARSGFQQALVERRSRPHRLVPAMVAGPPNATYVHLAGCASADFDHSNA